MNALKTVLSSLINFVAALWFAAAGLINWPRTGIMTVGALAGYLITAIGLTISALTFYKEFWH
ncbi:MAG: hypothetical protein ABIQ35_04470 [Verrucomicrobiota bacterium]